MRRAKKGKSNRSGFLYELTIKALEEYFVESGIVELPPLRELTEQFNVGESTMIKALRALAQRGVLSCARGRRARVMANEKAAGSTGYNPGLSKKGTALLNVLREEIVDGSRRAGRTLPKMDYLAAKMRISRRNVSSVFQYLCRENLIHKEGSRWIVGPANKPGRSFADAETVLSINSPVVLVVCQDFSMWTSLMHSRIKNKFSSTLYDELENYHVRTVLCGVRPEDENPFYPAGIARVRELIQSLGKRYRGTLALVSYFPIDLGTEYRRWLELFAWSGKPLVWCDIGDYRKCLAPKDTPDRLKLYSIVINEQSAVEAALKALYGAGHRRIGVPFTSVNTLGSGTHWSVTRMEICARVAKKFYPDMRIVAEEMKGEMWDEGLHDQVPQWTAPDKLISNLMQRIVSHASPRTSKSKGATQQRTLVDAASFLAKLIIDEKVTAIVAPNDFYACQFYAWFQLLHIAVPRDISLISFDNSTFVRIYPITTIDRGFSHMAYCAAHLFIKDIPIKSGRSGIISSKCLVLDRGSLAPPRRTRIML